MRTYVRSATTCPPYLSDRSRRLRLEKQLTLDEIAERLALSRTTVWYWIADLPLGRPRSATAGAALGDAAMQAKYRKLREDAYTRGLGEFDELVRQPTFRDFIVLSIAEGYKRNRTRVSIGNSDPKVVALSARWMVALTERPLTYGVQYHADQDLDELGQFWGALLKIEPDAVRMQPSPTAGSSPDGRGAPSTGS